MKSTNPRAQPEKTAPRAGRPLYRPGAAGCQNLFGKTVTAIPRAGRLPLGGTAAGPSVDIDADVALLPQ